MGLFGQSVDPLISIMPGPPLSTCTANTATAPGAHSLCLDMHTNSLLTCEHSMTNVQLNVG